jgi:hypothetical protein
MCGRYLCLLCETQIHRCFGDVSLSRGDLKNYLCSVCKRNIESHIEEKLNIQRIDKYVMIADALEGKKQKDVSTSSDCLICECDIGELSFTSANDYVCSDCKEGLLNNIKSNVNNRKEEKQMIILASIKANKKRVLLQASVQHENEKKVGLRD